MNGTAQDKQAFAEGYRWAVSVGVQRRAYARTRADAAAESNKIGGWIAEMRDGGAELVRLGVNPKPDPNRQLRVFASDGEKWDVDSLAEARTIAAALRKKMNSRVVRSKIVIGQFSPTGILEIEVWQGSPSGWKRKVVNPSGARIVMQDIYDDGKPLVKRYASLAEAKAEAPLWRKHPLEWKRLELFDGDKLLEAWENTGGTYGKPVKVANPSGAKQRQRGTREHRSGYDAPGAALDRAATARKRGDKDAHGSALWSSVSARGRLPRVRNGAKFTAAQIDKLRQEYGKIQSVMPERLDDFHRMFAKMDDAQLKQIVDAKIRWLSSLGINEQIRRKMASEKSAGKVRNAPLEPENAAVLLEHIPVGSERQIHGLKVKRHGEDHYEIDGKKIDLVAALLLVEAHGCEKKNPKRGKSPTAAAKRHTQAGVLKAMLAAGADTYAKKIAYVRNHIPDVSDPAAFVGWVVKAEKQINPRVLTGAIHDDGSVVTYRNQKRTKIQLTDAERSAPDWRLQRAEHPKTEAKAHEPEPPPPADPLVIATEIAKGERPQVDTPIRIRAATKDYSSRGSMREHWFRMLWDGSRWTYDWAESRLGPVGDRAADRSGTTYGTVFPGDLVAQHTLKEPIEKIYLVYNNETPSKRVESLNFSRRSGELTITLPDGTKIKRPDPRQK